MSTLIQDSYLPAAIDCDNFKNRIPKDLEINSDILRYIIPNESTHYTIPQFRLKKSLRYKMTTDDKEVIDEILYTRLDLDVYSVR